MAHRTAGMGAAAGAHHVGVAENDAHALDRHVKQIGDHLRETRLVALPGRLRADDDIDMGRAHYRGCTLMRACSRGAPIEDST